MFFLTILFSIFFGSAQPKIDQNYLYKAMFLRAAPGELLGLISVIKARMDLFDASGDERPFLMRHSQGDQWDLMLLFPLDDYSKYYSLDRVNRRILSSKKLSIPMEEYKINFFNKVSWHEEVFVMGPSLKIVKKAFNQNSFYHVEMFIALPGKRSDLYHQREMENHFLKELGRPENLNFLHDQGAAWDLFTIGCYRNLKHSAESADIPHKDEDVAAKNAGFEGVDTIGFYLRTLIYEHHDTLATAVK